MRRYPQHNQQAEPEQCSQRKSFYQDLETGHLYLNNTSAMQ